MNYLLLSIIHWSVIAGIFIFCLWFFAWFINPDRLIGKKYFKQFPQKPKILTKEEAEFMADYFHNVENMPDYDGFVGRYYLPEEVMEIYRRKYGKERYS